MSKIKRPLLAVIVVMGLAAGVASAYDRCNPCKPVRPIRSACYTPPPAPVMPVVSVCDPCAAGAVGTTTGAYVASGGGVVSYGGNSQVAGYSAYNASLANRGFQSYLIPTRGGLLETAELPIPNNEVDAYYSTHRIVGSQVQQVPSMRYGTYDY